MGNKTVLIMIFMLLPLGGCFPKLPFWKSKEERAIQKAEKQANKIKGEVKPPVKPWDIVKGEQNILSMVENDISAAKEAMTRTEMNESLNSAKEKVQVLKSSVGTSPEAVGKLSKRKQNKMIEELRGKILQFQEENYTYQQRMRDYELSINDLKAEVEKQRGVIGTLKLWLLIAIGVSVLVAAFVPGGALIVKRFWSGAFKTFHILGKQSYEALKETLRGLQKVKENPVFQQVVPGTDRKLWEIVEDEIKKASSNSRFVDEVRDGHDHFGKAEAQNHKAMRKAR